MRILVVGRSGQVAQSMKERGAPHHSVILAGRPDCDLTDEPCLRRAVDENAPGMIVNAAAYTAVDAAESDEAAAHALNAEGPGRLARLAADRHIPLIHLSTDYVFDGFADRPYREDDPVAPRSAYGRTKAAGEAAVAAEGGRAIIARTAWVYSPFGKNFVKTMLRVGATRDTLNVVDDQHGNPTCALDLADAIIALAERAERWPPGPDIVHMAAEGDTTWFHFARAIFAETPYRPVVNAITTAEYPTSAKRPANSRLDCSKLFELYGIRLPSWRTSLPPTVKRLLAEAQTDAA